jgi:hypothetical protein
VIGIEAIRTWLAKSQTEISAVDIIDYVLDFKEVKILGDEAIEWGRASITLQPGRSRGRIGPDTAFQDRGANGLH